MFSYFYSTGKSVIVDDYRILLLRDYAVIRR